MGIRQNKTKGATGWSTEPKLVLCPEAAACSGPAQALLARGAAARGWVTLLLGSEVLALGSPCCQYPTGTWCGAVCLRVFWIDACKVKGLRAPYK